MRYMLLLQGTDRSWGEFLALPAADVRSHLAFMKRLDEELLSSGELVSQAGLAPPASAMIVRAGRAGRPLVTRASVAGPREFLGGYFILDCDAERAIAVAARISASPGRGGAPLELPVEVRQVMRAPGEEM